MNKIAKLNFMGFAFSAIAIAATSAMISGCGKPPSTSLPAGVAPSNKPVTPPFAVPQNGSVVTDLTQLPANAQAQLPAILGAYTGTISFINTDGDKIYQDFSMNITKGTQATTSKPILMASVTTGNTRFTVPLQTTAQAGYGSTSGYTSFEMTTPPQPVSGFEDANVIVLQMNYYVSSNNVFDLANSTIRIMEFGSFKDVVVFYDDFARR